MTEMGAGSALGGTELPARMRQDQGDQVTTALPGTILDKLFQLFEQLAPYYILHILHLWEMKVILRLLPAKHQGESLFYKKIHPFFFVLKSYLVGIIS